MAQSLTEKIVVQLPKYVEINQRDAVLAATYVLALAHADGIDLGYATPAARRRAETKGATRFATAREFLSGEKGDVIL